MQADLNKANRGGVTIFGFFERGMLTLASATSPLCLAPIYPQVLRDELPCKPATVACRWRFAFMGQSRVGSHPFPRYRPPLGRPGYSGLLPSGWAYDVIIGYIR